MNKNTAGKRAILTALFAAFCCAGCFIRIPVPGGVPIVIQDMMSMLSGLILGPLYGGLAVFLFLVLGCLGVPVFNAGGGIDKILQGPTGGFLIGYMVSAIVGGLIVKFLVKDERTVIENPDGTTEIQEASKSTVVLNWVFITVAALLATVTCFVLGIIGFHHVKPALEMSKVYAYVLIPFIPGNIIKLIVMVPLTKKLRPIVKNYLGD